MSYSESRTDDIDELREWWCQGDWDDEIIQLSPGRLGYSGQTAQLPGLAVQFQDYGGQTLEICETKGGDHLSLALILGASGPTFIDGSTLAPGRFLSRAGQEQCQAQVRPNTRTLMVGVDPELVGGRRATLGIVSAAEPRRRALVAACRRLVEACRAAPAGTGLEERQLLVAREGVVRAMQSLLAPGLEPVAPQAAEQERFAVVQRARRRLMETRGQVAIPELARQLGVSERSLFRAFQQCLGVGPSEVEQLRRLHDFRSLLLALGPGRGRVAEAAAEAGFSHLGRLSGLYRSHFGERPRETLRRHARARSAG